VLSDDTSTGRDLEERLLRVEQNWGFGMAPAKPDEQQRRQASVSAVLAFIEGPSPVHGSTLAYDLSTVKGLYSRAFKRDQWDWFTVWQQLGRPTHGTCRSGAGFLSQLRRGVLSGEWAEVTRSTSQFRDIGGAGHLATFLDGGRPLAPGEGYLYVLSTRDRPQFLKIGFTERPVEERVRELNSDTMVPVPFGVRAAWVVVDARRVESQIHAKLGAYRTRRNREFFHVDFQVARRIIEEHLGH
jgi:hypothetical protein